MQIPFVDRSEERRRLTRAVSSRSGSLSVVYGRRRCGKSRLIQESLPLTHTAYYVGDDRESKLQREGVAREIARLMPGFNAVEYPGWDALLDRWWEQSARGTILALDEFPSLVAVAPELPSLLQKRIDARPRKAIHVVLAGSSQRMMHGLALDRGAPLFGRANEILKLGPLDAGWIQTALDLREATAAIEAYAVWGGVPRYWELASEHQNTQAAIRELVLSPLGVLHEEPGSFLRDDLRDAAQATSILALVGQGCHRLSEIAGRLGKPATSLSRPLQRLLELGLVRREIPFGATARAGGRSLYRIADPFVRFWFRFVEPNRSRLALRQIDPVQRETRAAFPAHVGEVWEDLARDNVPLVRCFGREWGPAGRWWGPGLDRRPLEIDFVAEGPDGKLLLGEAEWSPRTDARRLASELKRKAANLPLAQGREVLLAICHRGQPFGSAGVEDVSPERLLEAQRGG